MRYLCIAVIVCLAFLSPATVTAQKSDPKDIVEQGLEMYLKKGAAAAIDTWFKGSGLEGNTEVGGQLETFFNDIESQYGKPEGYDILNENSISPRAELFVFAINYSKGILYGRVQTYQRMSGNWVFTKDFRFNPVITEILPPELVFNQ